MFDRPKGTVLEVEYFILSICVTLFTLVSSGLEILELISGKNTWFWSRSTHTCPGSVELLFVVCLTNLSIVDLSFFHKGSIIHLINYSTNHITRWTLIWSLHKCTQRTSPLVYLCVGNETNELVFIKNEQTKS